MTGAQPGEASDAYVAFLDRQGAVFREERHAGYARLDLQPGNAVLDAGCGPGVDTFDLEELVGREGRVVGVDASETMIAVARKRASQRDSHAEFLVGDVRTLELQSETFDLVRAVLLLLHVEDPDAAVREMVRVLRPGGRIVCIDVDHQMDAVDATDLALAERVFRGRFADLPSPRIGRQLRGLFAGAGLAQVEVEVLPKVSTSWDQFNELEGDGRPTVFELAARRGDATKSELESLEADLRTRDAEGRFFACAARMRCSGVKRS